MEFEASVKPLERNRDLKTNMGWGCFVVLRSPLPVCCHLWPRQAKDSAPGSAPRTVPPQLRFVSWFPTLDADLSHRV